MRPISSGGQPCMVDRVTVSARAVRDLDLAGFRQERRDLAAGPLEELAGSP